MSSNIPETLPYLALGPDQVGLHPQGHRAPARLRLGTVTLQVADLQASVAFYQQVIGFEVKSLQEGVARMGVPGEPEVLLELREKKGVRPAVHRGRLGLYHFAVLLPTQADLGRFIRHAQGLGVHVGMSDHHYSEATYLKDPDGISIEVYRDRPQQDWVVSVEGEILGGGDPLDVQKLQEAARDVPYQGLPAGSTMGHLHFYVEDLQDAARFYHQGLGLDQVGWRHPTALFLSRDGYHHHIGLNTWAKGSPVSSEEDARLLTWELLLPTDRDLEPMKSSLQEAGFGVRDVGGADGFQASDPWGITVWVRSVEPEVLSL
ncbi:VOC family protein [Deinococcus roseus]|uniref:Glyoxalase n=1 Tax=Deinococcus roseus TaxID=392414 RepID=A0ABQ2CZE9_9DEIO|nr:VOC family protein [Deinococcus roseus]GGJ35648.1 glyoxalase [Deinococcus roseus]